MPGHEAAAVQTNKPVELGTTGIFYHVITAASLLPQPYFSVNVTASFVKVSPCSKRLLFVWRSSSRFSYTSLPFAGCTYSHFSDSSSCPACGMTLGVDDFLELCIADPSSKESGAKMAFQDLLTKTRSDSTHVTHQDMCMHALKSMDQCRRSCKFILKQMVMQQAQQAQNSGSVHRAFDKLQTEYTQLQQATTSERLEAQQGMQELQNRNSAMTTRIQEMEQKIKDQQRQISQFREHFRQSTGSTRSGGSNSSMNNEKRQPEHQGMNHRVPSHAPPPMHAFVKKKSMESSRQTSNKRPTPMGQSGENYHSSKTMTHPFAPTPIHFPNSLHRPSSGGSAGSRIREISSTSSYSFEAGRRAAERISPAMAFAKPYRPQPFH